ncbi:MAG TPA: hypothetical protein VLN73_03990, partial [Alphaproteobacteria bacterium]|nr:hypothetical protein [Alphaproteobacteria bacterium]
RLLGDGPGIKAQFYMLGFLDTPKLAAEPAALPRGDVSKLARMVHANLGNGSFTRWYPWWWRPLAWVLRMLPEGLYGWVVARRSG